MTDYLWTARGSDIEGLLGSNTSAPLYLDTEFVRERTFFPQLALVQINTGSRIMLVDAPSLDTLDQVRDLIYSRSIVLHACSEDLGALSCFFGALPPLIQDTQIGAALCGYDLQASYQKLVALLFGKTLDKSETRTNWLQRPLNSAQFRYAVQDVVYLPEIHQILDEKLAQLGRRDWWQEENERILHAAAGSVAPENLWRQVSGAGSVHGYELASLQQLAIWRDQLARERDLPRGFILSDDQMVALVRRGVRARHELSALGLHKAFVNRDGDAVLALLDAARDMEPPEPLPGPPSPARRAWMKQVKKAVAQRAAMLGVDPAILMRRRWLEAMASAPGTLPDPLKGWRYHEVILPNEHLFQEVEA